MQGEFPAGTIVLCRRLARGGFGVFRQADEFVGIIDPFGIRIGGVEHVFGKLRAQRRQLFLDFLEARLLRVRQRRTRQAEIAQRIAHDFLPRRAQRGEFGAGGQRLIFGEQRQVLAEFGIKPRDFRQQIVVGGAPGRHVIHRMQMADDAPGAVQAFLGIHQRLHEIVPGGRRFRRRQLRRQRAAFIQQMLHRRRDVFRRHRVETRQAAEIQQRVVGNVGVGRQGVGRVHECARQR